MITFIKAFTSLNPPMPGRPGGPGPPGLPIDNDLILLFFAAIIFGTYIHFKRVNKKETVKSSLN